jgi:sporulation and cell division protein SsgA
LATDVGSRDEGWVVSPARANDDLPIGWKLITTIHGPIIPEFLMRSRRDVGPITVNLSARVLRPGNGSFAARIHLRYDSANPYAVSMTVFLRDEAPIPWCFGRELLDDGCRLRSGLGNVVVAPCPETPSALLHITLRNEAREAVLELRRAPVAEFLHDTYRKVPRGGEGQVLHIEDDISALAP